MGNQGVNAVSWPAGVWKRYGADWMGTVVDGEALDPLMMDERDGTGDGECGKLIWVMGTPVMGVDAVAAIGVVSAAAGTGCDMAKWCRARR